MIRIKQISAGRYEIEALNEKAAKFLNTFVGKKFIADGGYMRSIRLEMAAHGCWIMGEL